MSLTSMTDSRRHGHSRQRGKMLASVHSGDACDPHSSRGESAHQPPALLSSSSQNSKGCYGEGGQQSDDSFSSGHIVDAFSRDGECCPEGHASGRPLPHKELAASRALEGPEGTILQRMTNSRKDTRRSDVVSMRASMPPSAVTARPRNHESPPHRHAKRCMDERKGGMLHLVNDDCPGETPPPRRTRACRRLQTAAATHELRSPDAPARREWPLQGRELAGGTCALLEREGWQAQGLQALPLDLCRKSSRSAGLGELKSTGRRGLQNARGPGDHDGDVLGSQTAHTGQLQATASTDANLQQTSTLDTEWQFDEELQERLARVPTRGRGGVGTRVFDAGALLHALLARACRAHVAMTRLCTSVFPTHMLATSLSNAHDAALLAHLPCWKPLFVAARASTALIHGQCGAGPQQYAHGTAVCYMRDMLQGHTNQVAPSLSQLLITLPLLTRTLCRWRGP
jgi:hypothetical protein